MLTLFHIEQGVLRQTVVEGDPVSLPEQTVWIDLFTPSHQDEEAIARLLGIDIPTHEEMQEIEASSRLYEEDGALVMTMPVLTGTTTDKPETTAVTFILTASCLVTVRYADPMSFGIFMRRLARQPGLAGNGEQALLGLLEQIVDRMADVLENTAAVLEAISHDIFHTPASPVGSNSLKDMLQRVGRAGDLAAKVKDSLLGLNRLVLFMGAKNGLRKDAKLRLKTLMRDANSIAEHGTFLSNKVAFLLDATLGMINIEQSGIIKLFTVAAMAFMPPTLIASIYGMNFRDMPELDNAWGYPLALLLMVLSAVLPLFYFRRKKWL